MSAKMKAAAELAAVLASETACQQAQTDAASPAIYRRILDAAPPSMCAADALTLMRIAATVNRWAIRACNGEGHREFPTDPRHPNVNRLIRWVWDDTDTAAHEKADAKALAAAQAVASRYGAKAEIGGDPRGFTLRLHLASGRKNGMGDGWGISA